MGVTVGDYDHDGKLDLFVTNFADEYNTLYRNDGKNSFTDLSYAAKVRRREFAARRLGHEVFRLRQRRLGRSLCRQRPRLSAASELSPAAFAAPEQSRRYVH